MNVFPLTGPPRQLSSSSGDPELSSDSVISGFSVNVSHEAIGASLGFGGMSKVVN